MAQTPSSISNVSAHQWQLAGVFAVVVVAVLGALYFWFLRGDYSVLTKGIRPEQAAAIIEQFKKEDVSYQLRDGGTTILVPTSELDDARLEVASGEFPAKGTVGFELFNQSNMGLTDFAQKVNYQRALQGEIARTIMAMNGIAQARVHIALPERSLFRTTRSEPRAAVTLTPQAGVEIDSDRIAGIQRLVAATIPDLPLDQVAVLNERGQLLTPAFSDIPSASSSQSAIEKNYNERVAGAIANVAPRAHVQAKVTVVPRSRGREGDASPATVATRDYDIRVVLFERSPLSAVDEQLIRKAVMTELSLDSVGDQLLFSPAPEIATIAPSEMSADSIVQHHESAHEAAQERFMANLDRNWTLALSAFAMITLIVFILRIRRGSHRRRQELASRIRQQLLLIEGAANAA